MLPLLSLLVRHQGSGRQKLLGGQPSQQEGVALGRAWRDILGLGAHGSGRHGFGGNPAETNCGTPSRSFEPSGLSFCLCREGSRNGFLTCRGKGLK